MKEIFQVLGIFSMFISALVGFFFWLIQRNINQRDAEEQRRRTARQQELDQREQVRYQHELYMLKSIDAAIALGEATARGGTANSGRTLQRRYARSAGLCAAGKTREERFPERAGIAYYFGQLCFRRWREEDL